MKILYFTLSKNESGVFAVVHFNRAIPEYNLFKARIEQAVSDELVFKAKLSTLPPIEAMTEGKEAYLHFPDGAGRWIITIKQVFMY